MKITVIGSGYVGLVTGACLADTGNHVLCIDNDAGKVERLRSGEIPIHEPGLDTVVARGLAAGRLRFSTDYQEAVDHAAVVFIAVGTPSDEDGSADLTHVLNAARELGRRMQRDTLVVTKSTVPVGTSDKVRAAVRDALVRGAVDAGLPAAGVHRFADSASAANAIGQLVTDGDLVLVKGSRGTRTDLVVALREPHHRAAVQHLRGVGRAPAAEGEEVAEHRAHRHDEVGRPLHAGPAHRDDPLDQRQPGLEDLGQHRHRAHVLHDHADARRQLAGRHLAVEHGLDEHLLGALRILDREREDGNVEVGGLRALERGDGVRLVALHADDGARHAEGVHHDAHAEVHALRVLHHAAVVGGEVRLALGTVDDDGVDRGARRRLELHVRRECRAAEPDDADLLALELMELHGRGRYRPALMTFTVVALVAGVVAGLIFPSTVPALRKPLTLNVRFASAGLCVIFFIIPATSGRFTS